jgi:Periplasmic protein involved in polysaccharide export
MRFDSPAFLLVTGFWLWAAPLVQAQGSVTQSAMTDTGSRGLIRSMDQLDNETRFVVGDQVNFRILEDGDAAVTLTVNDAGAIEAPYIGSVVVLNKTPRALAFEIKKALEADLYKKATVLVSLDRRSQRSPGTVYMTGEVAHQGTLELPSDERLTVSRAILRAGGFSDFANKRKVKLIRKSGNTATTAVIDVIQVMQKGRSDLDQTLQAGDVILVPARLINW